MNFMMEDLVRVAKRENNMKRPYLYVNPLQGKHIPADPVIFKRLCKQLADKINERYPADRILVIGFAETATAIALETAIYLNHAMYVECTTRENNAASEFSYFTESHSHATEQRIDTRNYKEVLREVDRVVFVEDEVTTGNTIMKLVDILKTRYANDSIRFTISSLLNSMSEDREKEISEFGMDCIYIKKLLFEYHIEKISEVIGCADTCWNAQSGLKCRIHIRDITMDMNQRVLTPVVDYRKQVDSYAEQVIADLKDELQGNVLVLGTEEFMHPAIHLSAKMAESRLCDRVKTHSTTRSPIIPSMEAEYPLYKRYVFRSVYDAERITYLYNLGCYDVVILSTDSMEEAYYQDICDVLASAGNPLIYIYRWRR